MSTALEQAEARAAATKAALDKFQQALTQPPAVEPPPDRESTPVADAVTEDAKPVEPIPPEPVVPQETDELTDDQLVQMAVEYLEQGTSSEGAVKKLLDEVDGIAQLDAERFVRLALEQQ